MQIRAPKRQKTQFFSTYDATYVFTKLDEYFKSHQIECKLSDKNFKLEFEAVMNLTVDAVWMSYLSSR